MLFLGLGYGCLFYDLDCVDGDFVCVLYLSLLFVEFVGCFRLFASVGVVL